jgi:hypothetical protein
VPTVADPTRVVQGLVPIVADPTRVVQGLVPIVADPTRVVRGLVPTAADPTRAAPDRRASAGGLTRDPVSPTLRGLQLTLADLALAADV